MISLVETGLMNALLAVGLALPVLILGRLWQRPALVHAFWILVLIKLVSPPLYQVPITWQMTAWDSEGLTAVALEVSPTPAPTVLPGSGKLTRSPQFSVLAEPASAWESASSHVAKNWRRWAGIGLDYLRSLLVPALCVWLIGSVCWFSWQGWRVVRFAQVFLRSAQIAPESFQHQAQMLARQMGLRSCPEVWLLPHVVSPMLWAVGGEPRILFPSRLLSRLDEGAVATLLTHELAHFRRGDHRVRLLEFLASGLFWWHPIVWIARREMEIAEEQCCDAWVVSQFPAAQRRYADALLATVDFLSEDHAPLPVLASGLGDVPMLRQRLKLIMCGTAPKSLSAVGRLAVILTAMLIPISPSLRTKISPPSSVAPPTASPSPSASHLRNIDLVQDRAARLKADIAVLSQTVEASRMTKHGLTPAIAVLPPEIESTAAGQAPSGRYELPSRPSSTGTLQSAPVVPRVWAIATAPNGLSRIVAWTNGIVEWQRIGHEATFDLTPYRISTILYSADGAVFLSGCRDGIVRVWDATTCRLLSQLEGHQASVRAIALSTQGNRLATADQHGLVLLWSLSGQAEVKTLTRNCSAVNSLAFSADGQTLALGTGTLFSTDAAQLQVWDLGTESLLNCLDHQAPLAVVKLSADGKSVSGAEWDGTLLTWDLESSTLISKRQINRIAIPATAFAPQS